MAWRHPTPSQQQVLQTETKGSFRSARLLGLRCPAWQVFSTLQTIDHYTETKSSHFSSFFTFVLLHKIKKIHVRSVQSLSRVRLFATPWTAARQASLSITNSWSLLKLMFIHWVMPSNHLILCRPPPPSIFPSIRVFYNVSLFHIRWPKYWSFSFSISSSNEYSGLISFRMDLLDLSLIFLVSHSLIPPNSSISEYFYSPHFEDKETESEKLYN